MGKVLRQDKATIQRILARDIVPGDIVQVASKRAFAIGQLHSDFTESCCFLLFGWCQLAAGRRMKITSCRLRLTLLPKGALRRVVRWPCIEHATFRLRGPSYTELLPPHSSFMCCFPSVRTCPWNCVCFVKLSVHLDKCAVMSYRLATLARECLQVVNNITQVYFRAMNCTHQTTLKDILA